jgi:release factor glutamine methyltransferase
MTVRELRAAGNVLLSSARGSALIDTPALDGALLLAEALGTCRTALVIRDNEVVPAPDVRRFDALLRRRLEGECVAYILGRREFRGLDFAVTPDVLVPRPDTETLVETALEYIDALQRAPEGRKGIAVLDLCTGSGAVAIALGHEKENLDLAASDVSPQALALAGANAERLLPQGSIRFIQSDLFENISGRFDLIVSNPPYVPSDEIDRLAPELQKEPRLALDGGKDGLALVRSIIAGAGEHLVSGGVLLLEADQRQMQSIAGILDAKGFENIKFYRDLAGKQRCCAARRPTNSAPCSKPVKGSMVF